MRLLTDWPVAKEIQSHKPKESLYDIGIPLVRKAEGRCHNNPPFARTLGNVHLVLLARLSCFAAASCYGS